MQTLTWMQYQPHGNFRLLEEQTERLVCKQRAVGAQGYAAAPRKRAPGAAACLWRPTASRQTTKKSLVSLAGCAGAAASAFRLPLPRTANLSYSRDALPHNRTDIIPLVIHTPLSDHPSFSDRVPASPATPDTGLRGHPTTPQATSHGSEQEEPWSSDMVSGLLSFGSCSRCV